MSKPGHIFKLEKPSKDPNRKPVDVSILKEAVSSKALRLLQQSLHIRSNKRVNPVELDIQEVETYPELEGRYQSAFERIERTPNSLFIVKFRGTHMVNVVVDPDEQSVVYLKKVSAIRHPSTSAGSHIKRLLGPDVMAFDGFDLAHEESPIRLVDKPMDQGILDIAVTSRKQMQASGSRARIGNVIIPKG